MNQIHYFIRESGFSCVACVEKSHTETVLYAPASDGKPLLAEIKYEKQEYLGLAYYRDPESKYNPCSREVYLRMRYKALAALVEFYGEFTEFTTPPLPPAWKELDPEIVDGLFEKFAQ